MGILCFTLFIFGIALIIIYAAVMRKHTRCSAQTQGMLKEIRKNRSRKTSRLEYRYSFYLDGIEYQFKTFDRSPQTNKAGDTCTIWYNPKKPKDALAHRYNSYRAFKILLIGGIVMILLALILPFFSLAMQAQNGGVK